MMYALIQNDLVINTIVWDGVSEVSFPDGVTAVAVSDGVNCSTGFTAVDTGEQGWTFTAPIPPPPAPPTAAEILTTNTAKRDTLLRSATAAMAPLQDAVDLGEATALETQLLTQWKQFRVAVNRIDLTQASPSWPVAPQAGWGAAISPGAVAADA